LEYKKKGVGMRRVMLGMLGVVMVLSALEASVYRGQREYLKQCKKCHGNGQELSQKYTKSEWQEFFDNGAQKLLEVHENAEEAKKYFYSERFRKKGKYLRQFFEKFAADGDVPACSD
jgi:hypothetical protein